MADLGLIAESPIDRLRAALATQGSAAMLLPEADEHLSEYLAPHSRRLAWATGFTGSQGLLLLLPDRAFLLVDGRYTLQAQGEVFAGIEVRATPANTIAALLDEAGFAGDIGYDPWLHSIDAIARLSGQLPPACALKPLAGNPVDALWADRPPAAPARAWVQPLALAGQTSSDKRQRIGEAVRAAGADAALLTHLDSIAWTLNIRGGDLPFTPVVRAFLLVGGDGGATLYVDAAKLDGDVRSHLGRDVAIRPYEAFAAELPGLGGPLLVDPETTPDAIRALAACRLIHVPDPTIAMRARKTGAEIAGARAAHLRDGVVLARFLRWLEGEAPWTHLDEIDASRRIEALRQVQPHYLGPSFAPISAFGANAALPHYLPQPGRAAQLHEGALYLLDSGGQYAGGTTDVTRTVALGEPDAAMRTHFTLALKGHLAIAARRFPPGTTGGDLDPLARQYLSDAGLDYATGTGHGLGSCLSVHEGPVFIGRRGGTRSVDAPLFPGLILTVEPGCYLAGRYGVRTENAYLIIEDGEGWLGFEPLTLAPIDRRLIDLDLITPHERDWLDRYHAAVAEAVGPHLAVPERAWLAAACAPL